MNEREEGKQAQAQSWEGICKAEKYQAFSSSKERERNNLKRKRKRKGKEGRKKGRKEGWMRWMDGRSPSSLSREHYKEEQSREEKKSEVLVWVSLWK